MILRRFHTVLLIYGETIARVDLSARGTVEVLRSAQMDRPSSGGWAASVQAAAGLQTVPCGRVWILSDEFWSGPVSLSAEVLAAVPDGQLAQALALEAEFDSGYNPFDSQLAYVAVASQETDASTWRVLQVESALIATLQDAVSQLRGRLAGLAAVHDAIPETSTDSGQRVGADPSRLAQQWLSSVLDDEKRMPVIRLAAPTLSEHQQTRYGLLAAAAALTLCWLTYSRTQSTIADLQSAVTQIETRQDQFNRQLRQNELLAKRAQELAQQNEFQLEAQQQRLVWRQHQRDELRRWPLELLQALASTASQDHWLQEIELSDSKVSLRGIALTPMAVMTLAQRLEAAGGGHWTVPHHEIASSDANGLVQFTLVVLLDTPSPGRRTAHHAAPAMRTHSQVSFQATATPVASSPAGEDSIPGWLTCYRPRPGGFDAR